MKTPVHTLERPHDLRLLTHQGSKIMSRFTLLHFCLFALVLCSTQAHAKKSKATQDQAKAQVSSASNPETNKALVDPSENTGKTIDDQGPVFNNPMNVRFKVIKLERGLSRDSRLFDAPRMFVLSTSEIPDLERMNCAYNNGCFKWVGQRLIVERKSSVDRNPKQVGVLKVVSVYQSTIKAKVIKDDLSNAIAKKNQYARFSEPKVVKLGDRARLKRPRKAAPPPKKRRVYKPKKRGKYERKEMKWQL